MVHHKTEEAIDGGDVVIVPVSSADPKASEWKLLLAREKMRNDTALDDLKWKVS